MNKENKSQIDHLLQKLSDFLTQLDWPTEFYQENFLKTSYRGEYGLSQVFIEVDTQFISLRVEPILDKDKQIWGKSVVSLVQTMGKEIEHVDVGISKSGELFAKVSIPTDQINLERFQCLLVGVCQVAENVMLPILQANAFDNLNNNFLQQEKPSR